MSGQAAARPRGRAFDAATTVLIGLVALLAAVLAILQSGYGLDSAHAAMRGSRLSADAEARIEAASLARDAGLRAKQETLVVGMEGVGMSIAALGAGSDAGTAVGTARQDASTRMGAAVDETTRTSGGAPLDSYTSSLLASTNASITAEVADQNAQVDLAADAGARSNRAVLALSLLTLGGVLAGIAAVLRVSRPGRITLSVAWAMVGAAALVTVLVVV